MYYYSIYEDCRNIEMHGWQNGEIIVLPKLATNPHVASKQASKYVGKVGLLRWYDNIIVHLVPPAAPTKNDDSD